MARSNDSSNDPPAGVQHGQLSNKDQSNNQSRDQANEQQARPGMSGDAAPGPHEEDDLEAERGLGARRMHKIADASHTLEGSAYQGAMEAVLAVPIAMGLGYWADDYFQTTPRYLIIGALVGFTAMVLRLVRMKGLVPGSAEAASQTSSPDESSAADAAGGVRDDDERRE